MLESEKKVFVIGESIVKTLNENGFSGNQTVKKAKLFFLDIQ